jgi:hypothetical protein
MQILLDIFMYLIEDFINIRSLCPRKNLSDGPRLMVTRWWSLRRDIHARRPLIITPRLEHLEARRRESVWIHRKVRHVAER